MRIVMLFVLTTLFASLGMVAFRNCELESHIKQRTELIKKSQAQVDELLQMNQSNLLTIQANYDTIQQLMTVPPPVYGISHHPFPGNPWILEVWWPEKLLWVPLVAYHHRTTAEDVKARLERGEVEERFLVR